MEQDVAIELLKEHGLYEEYQRKLKETLKEMGKDQEMEAV